jgi:AcrR family transcriptional regulator
VSLPAPLPGRRQRQVDHTRARLFQAAIEEFRRVGFGRASVSRIAREAGVSRPTFYFHFPTKEHVLVELEWIEECRLVERMEPARSLREALHALAGGIIDLETRLGEANLVRDMFSIYARRPAELKLDEQPYPVIPVLTRHFRGAAARGELRAGLEPRAAAQLCLVSLMGLQIGPPRTAAQRRADLDLLISLYLQDTAIENERD